ncbi:MAG: hypothetical protein ACRDLS_11945 [Solirubrobacteraceae bacterium]
MFYTAYYLDAEARELALGVGVTRFVPKPGEPAQIADAIRRALDDPPPAAGISPHVEQAHLRLRHRKLNETVGELERRDVTEALSLSLRDEQPLPQLTLDAQGLVVDASGAAERLLDIDPRGSNLAELIGAQPAAQAAALAAVGAGRVDGERYIAHLAPAGAATRDERDEFVVVGRQIGGRVCRVRTDVLGCSAREDVGK